MTITAVVNMQYPYTGENTVLKSFDGVPDDVNVGVTFVADYSDERNKDWAHWTPSLLIQMGVKGSVAKRFRPGARYILTFTEAE